MINLEQKYTPRINPGDADYPFGSIKGDSSPGAGDGTPLSSSWGNDIEGFRQAVMTEAGKTPSGQPDNAHTSQLWSAMKDILRQEVPNMGWTPVEGSFELGGTITARNQILWWEAAKAWYSWQGDLTISKVVLSGSTPASAGGVASDAWVDRTDGALREVVMPWLAEAGVSLKNKFGASDNSDITANLTAAINWSKLNGCIPVIIDVSGCSISYALPVLNNSFQFVPLYGRGSKISSVDITAAGDDVFTWTGGSGGLAGIVMKGLSLVGTTSQEPLLNKGLGGARFYDVDITAKTACKLSTDIGPGTFTEFVVFDSCRLHVKRIFTMQRGSGDGSFHGCGITNRTVVEEMAGNDGQMFVVGMPGDTQRCVWYNAPLDGHIFKTSTYPIIGNGRLGVNDVVMTVGSLTFENFTASPVVIGDLPPNVKHIHSGNILGWNLKYTLGSCVLASAASILPSGAIYGAAKPYVTEGEVSSTSINTGITEGAGIGRLVNIRIAGSNYDYQLLVHFSGRFSPFITPVAKIVDTLVAFNSSGWGPPIVSVNEYELVISNPAWTGTINWKASVGEAAI